MLLYSETVPKETSPQACRDGFQNTKMHVFPITVLYLTISKHEMTISPQSFMRDGRSSKQRPPSDESKRVFESCLREEVKCET